MASGVDLITLFIGLETMAVSFYILAGFLKPNQRSNEASVKVLPVRCVLYWGPAVWHVFAVRGVGFD